MNYILRLRAPFTDFILYISSLIKEKIYNRIKIFVSQIIWNFYFNFKHDGLLTAINNLLFDLHNILVPKSKLEIFSLLFFCYNFLPFCTDLACLPADKLVNINIVELLNMTYSIQDYLGLVILTYTIFIIILDLSICYISCSKQVKKFFPSLNLIINLALFLALVILVCIFLLLLFLLFDKAVEILLKYISEYIVKMLTSNPTPHGPGPGTGQPGGFRQPAGGGGKPPKKPGGSSPNKAHYKDKDDTDEELLDEESKKWEAKKANDRARSTKYWANKIANETEKEKENRLAKNRARLAKKRALKKENETVEEWQNRLAKSQLKEARRNLSETEKANLRRIEHREYIRNQTEEERQNRLAKNRAKRNLRWFQRDKGNKSDEEKK